MPPSVPAPPRFPTRRAEVIAAALAQLQDGDWTRLEGAPELERDLEAFHGPGVSGTQPEAWFVSSGTAALEAIMLGHEIGPGDEVVTTPYTWGATVSAVLAIGAIPVFADVDPLTGLIDPGSVERCVTPRTRAILVVHLFGHPVDCRRLRAIADRHGILLLEDGSQAHGARFDGVRVGAYGHAAAFSCMGLKLLAGTEGGYALFHDRAAAERAYLYGKHPRGLSPDRAKALGDAGLLDALQLGWRPCAVSAALIRAALPFLESENSARRRNAATLRAALAKRFPGETPGVELPRELPKAEGCYHLLSLVHRPERTGLSREAFQQRLQAEGVGTFVYIPVPIHRLKRLDHHGYHGPRVLWHDQLKRAGVDYRATACPGAEWRSRHTLEMGFNWTVDDPAAMEAMAQAIARAAKAA